MYKLRSFLLFVSIGILCSQCSKNSGSGINHTDSLTISIGGEKLFPTQASIDSFVAIYKSYSFVTINGDVVIGSGISSDIINISGFRNIVAINGNLSISSNTLLTSLNGLQHISHVSVLSVDNNALLPNLEGLNGLKTVNNFVWIEVNPLMQNLNGLDSLQYIKGDFKLENGAYGGSLEMNAELTNVNLPALLSIGGNVDMTNQQALTSVSIPKLDSIHGNFYIGVPSLKSFNGLNALKFVGGNFFIRTSGSTDMEGLGSLNQVVGNLQIDDNDYITSLAGLNNLNTIGNALSVTNNKSLISLDGLNTLNQSPTIVVEYNYVLTDFCALKNVISERINNGPPLTSSSTITLFNNSPSLPNNFSYQTVLTSCP